MVELGNYLDEFGSFGICGTYRVLEIFSMYSAFWGFFEICRVFFVGCLWISENRKIA